MSYEESHIVNVMKAKQFNWTFHLSRMMEDVSVRTKNRLKENGKKRKNKIAEEPTFKKISIYHGKQDFEILLLLCCEQESVKSMSKYHQVLSSSAPCNLYTTTMFF